MDVIEFTRCLERSVARLEREAMGLHIEISLVKADAYKRGYRTGLAKRPMGDQTAYRRGRTAGLRAAAKRKRA